MSGAVVTPAVVRQHRAKGMEQSEADSIMSGAESRWSSQRMKAGDALAFILIAVLGLAFAVTVKAPDLAALIEALIGGAP